MATNTTKAMARSIKDTSSDDVGMIIRGKYIFLMMGALFSMLFPAVMILEEKKFHSSKPEKTNRGYGSGSVLIFSARPKNKVKMSTISKGCMTTQITPRAVCLYLTLTSRQVKK